MTGTVKLSTALVDFDNLDVKAAAARIQSLSQQDDFSYVVTPNIDHMSRLCDSSESEVLLPIYQEADLCLCDSRILEKLLKLTGHQLNAVVPGSDLTEYIFKHTLSDKDKVLVFGGEEERVSRLCDLYPHLSIEHINPSMGFINKDDEVASLVSTIAESEYHYIFLAVGSPRQEVFAAKLKQAKVRAGVALCIGASINFLVGVEKRAPKVMQMLHIEWLYRMLQDPKRLVKRYVQNACSLTKIYFYLNGSQR